MIKYEIYELLKKSRVPITLSDIQKELSIDAECSISKSLSELMKYGVRESDGCFYSAGEEPDLGYDIF